MGIVKALPGVEVSIVVNGSALHEYEDTDIEDAPNTVTRYVEATSNANFEVHPFASSTTRLKGDCLGVLVFADGKFLSGARLEPRADKPGGIRGTIQGRVHSRGTLEKFCFNDLQKGKSILSSSRVANRPAHTK